MQYLYIRPLRYSSLRFSGIMTAHTELDWQALVDGTRTTVDWFKRHGSQLLDSWFTIMYCLGESTRWAY